MRHGLSRTAGHGLSGTRGADYRGLQSPANPHSALRFARPNTANTKSFGFLLTRSRAAESGRRDLPRHDRHLVIGEQPLTHVELYWERGAREHWLRFGKPVATRIVDRRRRVESYAPGQAFAFVRWAANVYGTATAALDIVRAVGPGEAFTTLAHVDPGGEVLLSVHGWQKVRRVFILIDAIEESGIDPCDVAPDHWRHVHNRIAAHERPRGYSLARHRAWLLRRRLA